MIIVHRIRNNNNEVYAIMSYEPLKNYLLMKWIGFSTDDEVKKASLLMLEWQKKVRYKKNCRFHVHDTKEIESAWAGLVDWINNEFFPLNYEYGLRYNISILSPDLFSKFSSLQLSRQTGVKVPTILCETLSQAERWMLEKKNKL